MKKPRKKRPVISGFNLFSFKSVKKKQEKYKVINIPNTTEMIYIFFEAIGIQCADDVRLNNEINEKEFKSIN